MKGCGKGPCKFGSSCTRKGCWYEHPAGHIVEAFKPSPCRYGEACTRQDCVFSHPPGRVVRSAPAKDTELSHGPVQGFGTSDAGVADARICVWFQKGRCTNGRNCTFRHVLQERDGNVIVVLNLSKVAEPSTLEKEIRFHFEPFGYIARVQVKTDLGNNCRGFAFVIFDNADSVDKALRTSHRTWDIKRKVDLQGMYVEGDKRPSRKTSAAVHVDAPLRLPFGLQDRVLLVGEGDFSYTLAAVKCGFLSPSNALATSHEPPRNTTSIERLREKGLQCRVDVDATSLALTEDFDVIIFNFPHTGEPSIERNQDLLKSFFKNARTVLRRDARVAVSLKQTWPYSDWDLEKCAAEEGFHLVEKYGFPARVLHACGYMHSTTDNIPHQVDFLDSAVTFEFTTRAADSLA